MSHTLPALGLTLVSKDTTGIMLESCDPKQLTMHAKVNMQ